MSQDLDGIKWLFKEEFGFDTIPQSADWEIYAKSLLICAAGDGEVAQAERQWIVGFCAAHGAPPEFCDLLRTWNPSGDHKELIESRETGRRSRRSLIHHAIMACSADGEFHDAERAAVRRLAEPLGVSAEVVGKLEDLVAEEARLRERRLALLFADGKPF